MTIAFPNRSRTFDAARNAVRFIGYDGMFEVPFLVEAGAIGGLAAGRSARSESDCLTAFDAACTSIHDVARKAYKHGRRHAYILTAADFS